MFKKIKEICHITANVRGQSVSIKRRINLYWLSMAVALITALMLVLSIAGVFSNSAKRLEESLNLQQQNSYKNLTDHMDSLEAAGIMLSKAVSNEVKNTVFAEGIGFDELNDNEELIEKLERNLYALANTTLQSAKCNGVYILMNATCNTQAPGARNSRMGVYLRYSDLSGINMSNKHIVYYRGSAQIARDEKIQMHNRWNLEFDISLMPGCREILESSVERLADNCIWTERVNLKDTWENAVLLYVPVLGNNNEVLGVCGIELSSLYLRLAYPVSDSPYGEMSMMIVPAKDHKMMLEKTMPGYYSSEGKDASEYIRVEKQKHFNEYDIGEYKYIGLQKVLPAKMEDGSDLELMTLISEKNYRKESEKERVIWMTGLGLVLISMIILSRILSRQFVTPINQMIQVVRDELPLDGKSSGISEIDELVEYFSQKAQNQKDYQLPPNVEELFQVFVERTQKLTPMEHTVLQYYIDGYTIEEVAEKSFISVNTVKKHNTNINRKLGVTNREELLLYIDLFRRCGRIDDISYRN